MIALIILLSVGFACYYLLGKMADKRESKMPYTGVSRVATKERLNRNSESPQINVM